MPDSRDGHGLGTAAATVARLVWRAGGAAFTAYLLLMTAEAAVPVVVAWSTKRLVDALVDRRPVLPSIAVLAAVGLVAPLLPAIGGLLNNIVGRSTSRLATARLFEATGRLGGLARFEDPPFADRLRLAQQGAASSGSLASAAFGAGRGILMVAGFVGSLLIISPVLCVVLLLTGVPVLVAQLRLSRRRADLMLALGPVERRELFYARLLTTVNAAKEIRLFGIGDFLRERMLAERRSADAATLRLDRREAGVEAALGVLGAAAAGAGLIWAALAAARGQLGVGDLTVLLAAVASVQGALHALIGSIAGAHQSLLLFGHYVAVLHTTPDLPVRRPGTRLPALRRGIELRDVWFRYSEDHPWILRGVDLLLPYGSSVALIGLNGAGKSTLVKLLCRLYDPTRGSIHWDGVDLRDVPADELRARMSCVFQDYFSYDLTAAENIAIGDLSAREDPERLGDAARRAGIHDKLRSLPGGYDTLLSRLFLPAGPGGADGVVLSGGEWQRVALARAFLRDRPDLVILDEPSAGLDAEAEHQIHATTRAHREGRTTLLVSHRLNTVRDADLIVVLDGGRISERGTHESLVAADGVYARLFRIQSTGYRDEPEVATAQPLPGGYEGYAAMSPKPLQPS